MFMDTVLSNECSISGYSVLCLYMSEVLFTIFPMQSVKKALNSHLWGFNNFSRFVHAHLVCDFNLVHVFFFTKLYIFGIFWFLFLLFFLNLL